MITAKNKTEATEAIVARTNFKYNHILGEWEKSGQELTEIDDLMEFAKQNDNYLYVIRSSRKPIVAVSESNETWIAPKTPENEKDFKLIPSIFRNWQINA